MAEPIVKFDNVSIVFGDQPKRALPLIDQNRNRTEIQQECGQILGVANCSLEIEEGEVLVLMGLSGSGKSTLLRAVNALNPVVRGSVSVRCPDNNGLSTWRDPHACSKAELRELRLDWVSMVVIAALVGAPGLGVPVVRALNTVNIARGFEAGIVIVLVAILLDRFLRHERQGG